uniref:Uncharacterized protein n=1 Tax=Tanacetum cinerariifolium TaxID=118510 RepID=A0A6L2LL05_TANCI|nr:hypothetical protein [Tanacetum cinerariifolium]
MGYQKPTTSSNNSFKKTKALEVLEVMVNTTLGFESSRSYGGSKNVRSASGSGGNEKEKITPISEVDPVLDDICIQGRCISIWHSQRMNVAHDPYSLDLVLQDVHKYQQFITPYLEQRFL